MTPPGPIADLRLEVARFLAENAALGARGAELEVGLTRAEAEIVAAFDVLAQVRPIDARVVPGEALSGEGWVSDAEPE